MTTRDVGTARSTGDVSGRSVDRRTVLKGAAALLGGGAVSSLVPGAVSAAGRATPAAAADVEWVVTTRSAPWTAKTGLAATAADGAGDVIVSTQNARQTIDGFGACFNELGWTSLSALGEERRDAVLR